MVFVLYYSIIKFNTVYNKDDPSISYNTVNFPSENFSQMSAEANYFDFSYSIWFIDSEENMNLDFEYERYFEVNLKKETKTLGRRISFEYSDPLETISCENSKAYNSLNPKL
jgi:hypothetical protein